jgi:hypothetical protein
LAWAGQENKRSCLKKQVWKMELSAENILYHIQKIIESLLPQDLKLVHMKIYETKDSFAEWFAD